MKERLIKWGLFLKKNWYAALLSVVCVFMVGGLPHWAGAAAVAASAFGFVIYLIAK